MTKSILALHTANFLLSDAKHLSAHVLQNLECPQGTKTTLARLRFVRHYNMYCLAVLRTISCPVCISVQARVYCTSNFTCAFFTRAFHTCVVYMPIPLPAQSIWCTLHAISITCAIHTPKMTITRSFITRALSHPISSHPEITLQYRNSLYVTSSPSDLYTGFSLKKLSTTNWTV